MPGNKSDENAKISTHKTIIYSLKEIKEILNKWRSKLEFRCKEEWIKTIFIKRKAQICKNYNSAKFIYWFDIIPIKVPKLYVHIQDESRISVEMGQERGQE